jgi:hypothetical protein
MVGRSFDPCRLSSSRDNLATAPVLAPHDPQKLADP